MSLIERFGYDVRFGNGNGYKHGFNPGPGLDPGLDLVPQYDAGRGLYQRGDGKVVSTRNVFGDVCVPFLSSLSLPSFPSTPSPLFSLSRWGNHPLIKVPYVSIHVSWVESVTNISHKHCQTKREPATPQHGKSTTCSSA